MGLITIVASVLGVTGLGTVGLAVLMSELMIRPRVQPLGPDPSRDGIPFETVFFELDDRICLSGWLVGPALPGSPVLILHGYTGNKSSFIPHARFLYEQGIPSLLLDLRGHGGSTRARVSLGPLEAEDVVAVLEALRRQEKGKRFVLWGISMGAATAQLAAARTDAVGGVISESSYERLDEVVAGTLRLRYRIPRFPLVPLALRLASCRLRTDLRNVSIPDAVEALGDRPLLVISGGRDPRMSPRVGDRILARAANAVGHVVVDDADHGECWALGQPAYGERVLELIEAARKPFPAS